MKCDKCNRDMTLIAGPGHGAFGAKRFVCKQCSCNHEMILRAGPAHGAFGPSRLVCKKCSYETPKHAMRSQTSSSAQSVPPPPAPPSVSGSGSAAATMGVDITASTSSTLTLSLEDATVYDIPLNWADVDLTVVPALAGASSITVGDIHGNTSTLLIILIKSGIIELNKQSFDIAHNFIKSIDERGTILTWGMYAQFCDLLQQKATVRVGGQPVLRLLGDDLADRMSNDALTLEVIGLLSRNHYPIICIIGNHDMNFYLSLCAPLGGRPWYDMSEQQVISNVRFGDFVLHQVRTVEQRKRVAANIRAYTQALCLFDCSLLSSGTSQIFTIFSHACFQPVDSFILMGELTHIPQTSYAQFTPETLKKLIDRVNGRLRIELLDIVDIWEKNPHHNSLPSPNPIDWFMINSRRSMGSVLWYRIEGGFGPGLPVLSDGTRTNNIHGHDRTCREGDLTLDSDTGKSVIYYNQLQYLPVVCGNSAATTSSAAVPPGVVPPPTVPPTPTGVP